MYKTLAENGTKIMIIDDDNAPLLFEDYNI